MKKTENIKICKRCFYSNTHPLGITFNKDGICSGCQIHEEKNSLNWKLRLSKLKKIAKEYKSNKHNYDCIVPVTGANDSYFMVHIIKNILKLNPLLVCYNKYFNTPLGIKNLSNLRIKFNSDILFQNVNQNSVKKITKYTLMEFGNMYWPVLAGHSVFPVQTSVRFKIPLIFWGAHQGLEQVGMFSHLHEVEMTRRYREDHDLFGKDEKSLISLDNDIREEDIWQYKYPETKELRLNGTRGIYLGNYIRWDSVMQHKFMVKKYNFTPSSLDRTFDTYDHTDCFNFINIHDYLKLCKHGFSKVTDHVCREIRFGRISRENGYKLIRKYELVKPKYIKLFCEWLEINPKSLDFVINRFKNKNFWKQYDVNKWHFKGLSSYSNNKYTKIKDTNIKMKNFIYNDSGRNKFKKYIFFGKGI